MSLSKRKRQELLRKHCGAINSDDAIDPRHYFYNKKKPKNAQRKALQLCRQVAETLQLVLTGGDEQLEGLSLVDVVPAPDSRRMLVIVGMNPSRNLNTASDVEAVMDCLRAHIPRLRSEIARTIHRKKTPQLVFELSRFIPQAPQVSEASQLESDDPKDEQSSVEDF